MIHDDGDSLDVLTRLFEASGFEVVTAVTGFRAQAHLEADRASDRASDRARDRASDRAIDVVVVPWDAAHSVGGEVYRWSLQRRYDLRDMFIFLTAEAPPEFDRLVAGRCLTVSMARPAELTRVAFAAVKRRSLLEAARDAATTAEAAAASNRPTLLVADDEPVLLMVIGDLLSDAGFAVSKVDSGHGAILLLEHEEFDAIICDWDMDDGNGADVFRWIISLKPWLADRVVFLSGAEGDDAGAVAPGRPMFRKGQDSHALTTVLYEIVRQVRGDATVG